MMLTTRAFWAAASERAVKTVAQSAAALITASASGLLDVDWLQLASIAGLAGLVSILTSIGSDALTNASPTSVAKKSGDSKQAKAIDRCLQSRGNCNCTLAFALHSVFI